MKAEELKNGMFIKWYANRIFKGWDTYGKVVSMDADTLTIVTFDDFKEVTISKTGEALESEITEATKEKVMDYMEERRINLNTKVARIELETKKQIRDINTSIIKMDAYYSELLLETTNLTPK